MGEADERTVAQPETHAPAPAGLPSFLRDVFCSVACWRVMAAVALASLSVLLMNRALFPLFDGVFTYARDISIVCSGLFAIGVGLVSLVRPALLNGRALCAAMVTCLVVGAGGMGVGIALGHPALLIVGACLFTTGRGWSSLSSAFAAVCLPMPQAMACLACGLSLGQLLDVPMRALPQVACVVVLPVAAAAAIVLSARSVSNLVAGIASAPSAAELSVTRPASYLPLTSNLYVCLILVQMAFGFALRFGEVGGSPVFGGLAVPFMLAVALVTLVVRGRFFGDALVNVIMLALVAGFLLVVVGGSDNVALASSVLTVGTSLFNILLYTTLVSLAGRNSLASLSIMGWGQGLSGIATTLGAFVGTTANRLDAAGSHEQLAMLVAIVTLALVAYALFGLRGFSFESTIAGVVPPEPDVDLERAGEEAFAARCSELAARYDLTPREAEVCEMLARGRNREHIEGALGVSRNTVKAHVKHVYAKLGIHSHQELIDLFERKDS
ncbi:MAG: helix-turn-helix transcriptional regulator [Coriobacteriia bacterium]|nr:helix-turn-helix transcriptional regulator [Coriobacteriia bacterium]MBS5477510.1 helix-turn-helix transcriptional regulator [Coriobacteriia bacterium]